MNLEYAKIASMDFVLDQKIVNVSMDGEVSIVLKVSAIHHAFMELQSDLIFASVMMAGEVECVMCLLVLVGVDMVLAKIVRIVNVNQAGIPVMLEIVISLDALN